MPRTTALFVTAAVREGKPLKQTIRESPANVPDVIPSVAGLVDMQNALDRMKLDHYAFRQGSSRRCFDEHDDP
jgi:hypothetical protein